MFKLANQVLDFLDEKTPQELGLDYVAPEKDYDYGLVIKTASGDILKKYPLNNVENVAFSAASYEHNKYKLTSGMQKIAEASLAKRMDLYNLPHTYKAAEDVKGNYYISNREEEQIKVAEKPPTEFAFGDKLPMDTIPLLQKSASEFIKGAKSLPVKARKEVAFNLVKKAEAFGVELPTGILQYSSMTPKGLKQMKTAMATRMTSYPSKVKQLVDGLIENTKTASDAIKLSEMVEKIDETLGLKSYNHADTAGAFFSIDEHVKEKEFGTKLASALDENKLDVYFDKEVVSELKDSGYAYFKSLDKNSQNVIEAILNK